MIITRLPPFCALGYRRAYIVEDLFWGRELVVGYITRKRIEEDLGDTRELAKINPALVGRE